MKAKAIATRGKDLSEKALETLHNPEEDFQLDIGEIYTIYGISIWVGTLHYLTYDKWHNDPFWHPAELFEVVDSRIPPGWHFRFSGHESDDSVSAVWGYKELALDPSHYWQLVEREGYSLVIFNVRRKEADQMYESSSESD